MLKKTNLFFVFFIGSFVFGFLTNIFQKNLEDFLYLTQFEKNPLPLAAQIQNNFNQKERKEGNPEPAIEAKSAFLLEVEKNGQTTILFEKNAEEKLAIASIAKLMTALVAQEFYKPSFEIQISKKAVSQEENTGGLKTGEILNVNDLLFISLIESSNDAAFALTQPVGEQGFAALMNLKAGDIGMTNTHFANPTGLDPKNPKEEINISTANDLATLLKYILAKPLILEIISKKEYDLFLENGTFHHRLLNTNELIGEMPGILGGKTGYTEKAGGCLVLIAKGRNPQSRLIGVILNSPNRFEDMKKLIGYAQN